MHVINIEWRSEQGDLCEGANADFSLHSFLTFVDFFQSKHLWVVLWRSSRFVCFFLCLVAVTWLSRRLRSHLFGARCRFQCFAQSRAVYWWSPAEWKAFHWVRLGLLSNGPVPQLFIVHCGLRWSHSKPLHCVNKIAFAFLICIFSPVFDASGEKPFSFSPEADRRDRRHVSGVEVGTAATRGCTCAPA